MIELNKLIDSVVKDGKMTKEDAITHLVEALENRVNPEDEFHEIYEAAYGKMITKELAEKWIRCMTPPSTSNHKDGMRWEYDTAIELGNKVGVSWNDISKIDWWVVLNMMYSDHYESAASMSIADPMFYGHMAKDWLMDDDVAENKLYNYYFYVVKS